MIPPKTDPYLLKMLKLKLETSPNCHNTHSAMAEAARLVDEDYDEKKNDNIDNLSPSGVPNEVSATTDSPHLAGFGVVISPATQPHEQHGTTVTLPLGDVTKALSDRFLLKGIQREATRVKAAFESRLNEHEQSCNFMAAAKSAKESLSPQHLQRRSNQGAKQALKLNESLTSEIAPQIIPQNEESRTAIDTRIVSSTPVQDNESHAHDDIMDAATMVTLASDATRASSSLRPLRRSKRRRGHDQVECCHKKWRRMARTHRLQSILLD